MLRLQLQQVISLLIETLKIQLGLGFNMVGIIKKLNNKAPNQESRFAPELQGATLLYLLSMNKFPFFVHLCTLLSLILLIDRIGQ